MKLTATLLVSLAFNLALGAAALALWQRHAASTALPRIEVVTRTTAEVQTNSAPAADALFVTNKFRWSQIASTNCEEYVVNLRATGCPEQTVRDIVIADVDRAFERRHRLGIRELPFWAGGKQRAAAREAERIYHEKLDDECCALLKSLLDIEDCPIRNGKLDMNHFEEQALARFLMGPLADATFRRAVAIAHKYEEIQTALDDRVHGIFTDDDEDRMRRLSAQFDGELGKVLGASQLEEMRARFGATLLLKNEIQNVFQFASDEARQLSLAHYSIEADFDLFDLSKNQTAEEKELRERQFTNTAALVLGAERYAEFQRVQDSTYRDLLEFSQDQNLPRQAARAVYDVRQLAAEEVAQLRANETLDVATRAEKIQAVEQDIQRAVAKTLGAKAYGDYLKSNGQWLTNVSSL
jgi:hypothetical protein